MFLFISPGPLLIGKGLINKKKLENSNGGLRGLIVKKKKINQERILNQIAFCSIMTPPGNVWKCPLTEYQK